MEKALYAAVIALAWIARELVLFVTKRQQQKEANGAGLQSSAQWREWIRDIIHEENEILLSELKGIRARQHELTGAIHDLAIKVQIQRGE